MDSVWVKSPVESNSPMENVIKFNVKSEPEFDTMIENKVEPDSMTDSVLNAEIQVKSEPEAIIWMKSKPETDDFIKREAKVDVHMEDEADQGTAFEFPASKVEDSKVCTICSCVLLKVCFHWCAAQYIPHSHNLCDNSSHGHIFLHSWSGPMTLVVDLLHGATFLSNLPLVLF